MNYIEKNDKELSLVLSQQTGLTAKHIEAAIELLNQDNTIPFIARYRKELTGSMDDEVLRNLQSDYNDLLAIESRRKTIFNTLETLGVEDEKLTKDILSATTLTRLEDLYRPYKPKRKTRATIAISRGLEPLSKLILNHKNDETLLDWATSFLETQEEKEGMKKLQTIDEVLLGASDILAEQANDSADLRSILIRFFYREGLLISETKTEEDTVFRLYYNYRSPINKSVGHRILAINRGEKQDILKVSIELDETIWLPQIENFFKMKKDNSLASTLLQAVCQDSYKRLLKPSLENQIRNELTENAHQEAIELFKINLKNALLVPPMKKNVILALDPGYRHGCKWAVVNESGDHLESGIIYPIEPFKKIRESEQILRNTILKNKVTLCVIGNGTGGRETEQFFSDFIKKENLKIGFLLVDESGASVYSASPISQEELPDIELNLRSAVSLARRIQDPLAELVKIEPNAIGVGQYQHDMNQKLLLTTLGGVTETCVNQVGVSLNTASPSLLSYVAGISKTLATNIVNYRKENGPYTSRAQLKKVPKLGPKAFEQAAGFLRIEQGKNPFDNTSIHPESYDIAKKLMNEFNLTLYQPTNLSDAQLAMFAIKEKVGLETLRDINEAISMPARDIRDSFPTPKISIDVMSIEDSKVGQTLNGVVRNVTAFGAFVDLGVHQDGLVHISQLSNSFVKDPTTIVKVGQEVTVRILEVDVEKKRISLSMKHD
ncbi:MAG: RNA-binding transcriptional accessory protein [Erysipelothrix sp.]|nr:RNA-binding transcriptional accessory protein [Erysipelothrix sp.]